MEENEVIRVVEIRGKVEEEYHTLQSRAKQGRGARWTEYYLVMHHNKLLYSSDHS